MAISSGSRYLFLFSILVSITNVRTLATQCLEDQKTLLLELRSELIFDSSHSVKLTRWNDEQTDDCCAWHGVECDAAGAGAGRVISLQLDDEAISGGLNESSTLFRLNHLEKLNLAFNVFNGAEIPRAIHRLPQLTHLNLSGAGFGGEVPLEVSLLTRLVSLDISADPYDWEHWTSESWDDDQPSTMIAAQWDLGIPNLKMLIRNLTRLREVYLDGVDISGAGSEWCQPISSSLPQLNILSLRNCNISGPLDPSLLHLHSLSVLHLDYNNLSPTIPDFLANFSSLTTLSLCGCSLGGSFPKMIWQVPTLQMLDLSDNDFLSSSLPQFPLNKGFREIYMSGCGFAGPIPSTFSNLTELIHLDLSFNSLTAFIPSFHMSKKLKTINLSYNALMGSLTNSHFGGLASLTHLDLAGNSLSGTIPHSLFRLPSLQVLSLSNNQFGGIINGIPINISTIVSLNLAHNSLIGSIPCSLFALPSLQSLFLSNNQFSGKVNEFSTDNITELMQLDLSTNQLEGPIPHSFFQVQSLNKLSLSHNLFNAFPTNVSFSLWVVLQNMDLSNNQIVGDIPAWLWEIQTLEDLNMCCNLWENLQKPYQFSTSLSRLDLHSNRLQGELPPLPQNARYVDYSSNYFSKPIPPTFFGNVSPYIDFVSLANNSLSGAIPIAICNVSLGVLSLSFNNLSSIIPPCVVDENTKDLQVLNLRGNNIFGVILNQFSVNCSLRTLELSNNILGGKIPKSLENCKQLEVMNVGYNNFDDNFPCMLSPSLHVLLLHSNKFHGEWRCNKSWPNLQIVDISSNNFSGSLHTLNFSSWGGMMLHFKPHHFDTEFLGWNSLYQNEVTLTTKGIVVKLVKIRPDFTCIDLSCNNFQGDIPDAIGNLTSLYLLNLSHNALTGTIPKSMGVLTELESLDLSFNHLRGRIPEELAGLTFLSILNVSYNELVGIIPTGPQLQTFPADSFEGNAELCGFPLNTSCSRSHGNGLTAPKVKYEEIEWEYVGAALGYVVGLGSIAWILLFWRRFRERYFDKIEQVAERIMDRSRRQRRRRAVSRRNEIRI